MNGHACQHKESCAPQLTEGSDSRLEEGPTHVPLESEFLPPSLKFGASLCYDVIYVIIQVISNDVLLSHTPTNNVHIYTIFDGGNNLQIYINIKRR